MDWAGLTWTGLDWPGLGWTDLDWAGLTWTDLDWSGLTWTDLDWLELPQASQKGWTDVILRAREYHRMSFSSSSILYKCQSGKAAKATKIPSPRVVATDGDVQGWVPIASPNAKFGNLQRFLIIMNCKANEIICLLHATLLPLYQVHIFVNF